MEQEKLDKREISYWNRTYELLKQERHDFFNVLQVVSGHLQLGNHEKALAYINRASSQSKQSSSVFNLHCLELSLLLLERHKYHTTNQMHITYQVKSNIEEKEYENVDRLIIKERLTKIRELIDGMVQLLIDQQQFALTLSMVEEKGKWTLGIYAEQEDMVGNLLQLVTEKELDFTIRDQWIFCLLTLS